ncbi:hypothetical protein HAX54_003997 [Datura stramonium]|uniref:Uncharacterized protein n=1 Tax=Datura stramonium TaxID=4076 RepID=A0ABS8WVK8_DATST|nr:hypothetical protein [Datura stramonium]
MASLEEVSQKRGRQERAEVTARSPRECASQWSTELNETKAVVQELQDRGISVEVTKVEQLAINIGVSIVSLLSLPSGDLTPPRAPGKMQIDEEEGETNENAVEEEDDPGILVEKVAQIRVVKKESLMVKGFRPNLDKEAGTSVMLSVSMANPVAQLNLPQEDMTEAQRAEAGRLVEEAQLADTARKADAAN